MANKKVSDSALREAIKANPNGTYAAIAKAVGLATGGYTYRRIDKIRTNSVIKKGGKREVLVYFDRTKEAAALWLEQRGEDDNPSLWVGYGSRDRKVGSANSWCEYMSKVLSELEGRKIHFTPHALRHSAIENLTEGHHYKCEIKRIPYDIKAVSRLASHASTDMTASYKKDKGLRSIESVFGVKIS